MDNLIFKPLLHQNVHHPAWREAGPEPPWQSQTHWRRNWLPGPWPALPPSTHCSPLAKHGGVQPPWPKSKELEHVDRALCSCAARCGTPQPSLTTLGAPMGIARDRLDRKQRRRGKSEGSSSELFNTSLYCLCF